MLNSMGGVGIIYAWVRGFMGGNMGQILAWVVWVHKILAWVKKMVWIHILACMAWVAWLTWVKILVWVMWVVWVHKMFAWVEMLAWVKNSINILYILFLFTICICSWHLSFCIPYVYFHIQIGMNLKLCTDLNPASYFFMYKIKWVFFNRFPYLLPEAYLESISQLIQYVFYQTIVYTNWTYNNK